MRYKNETDSAITFMMNQVEHTVEPDETVDVPVGIGRRAGLTLVD